MYKKYKKTLLAKKAPQNYAGLKRFYSFTYLITTLLVDEATLII